MFLPPLVLLAMMLPWRALARGLPGAADAGREHGTVKWFDARKGFGFIVRPGGDEVFVHFRSVRGVGRRGLQEGQPVTFRLGQGRKGPQAEDVEPG